MACLVTPSISCNPLNPNKRKKIKKDNDEENRLLDL